MLGLPALLRGEGAKGGMSAADALALDLQRAEQKAGLCSGTNPAGVGLRGEYFPRESLQGKPLRVRVDPTVDFDASLDWPAAAERARSVRWSGWVKPPLTGRYRFHADAPEAVLTVAGQAAGGAGDAGIELAAGRYYPVVLELRQLPAAAQRIRLEWTAPHGARYVVPRALLFLPTESVQTPAAS